MKDFTLYFLTALALGNCRPGSPSSQESAQALTADIQFSATDSLVEAESYRFPYDLEKPFPVHKLSGRLKEISGLGLSADGGSLLAVNDEEGVIFFVNKQDGKITRKIKFGGPGDYEGIEKVEDRIYVIKSNGSLYEVSDIDLEKPEINLHRSPLSQKENVEGLAYDECNHRLLIACKGTKEVYAFDLDPGYFHKSPEFKIKKKSLLRHPTGKAWAKEIEKGTLAPSALAVHPETGDYFLLSSKGKLKLLLVLSPSGKVLHIEKLDRKVYFQPEGICFGPDGSLFISSEASSKYGSGRLYFLESS